MDSRITIDFECRLCGSELEIDYIDPDTIQVLPCGDCIDDARADSYNEGHGAGMDDGYENGYSEGYAEGYNDASDEAEEEIAK